MQTSLIERHDGARRAGDQCHRVNYPTADDRTADTYPDAVRDRARRLERMFARSAARLTDAIAAQYDERGAVPTDDGALLAPDAVRPLRDLDITCAVPDAMTGARHAVKVGRNKRGPTRVVVRRGTAPVQGATEWDDTAPLAAVTGTARAMFAAYLAEHLNARHLVLGRVGIEIERFTTALLHAVDGDASPGMLGTDAQSWEQIVRPDRVELPDAATDADAMTRALLVGVSMREFGDTMAALSRHRVGITGGMYDAPIAQIADTTAPVPADTAPWPVLGPRSTRPVVARLRRSETHLVRPGELVGRVLRERRDAVCHAPDEYGRPCEACAVCAARARWNQAAARIHVGNATYDRGPRANERDARRPTTRGERAERQAAATAARAAVPEVPAANVTAAKLAVMPAGHAVNVRYATFVASVRRGATGRWAVRAHGARVGMFRDADAAANKLRAMIDA